MAVESQSKAFATSTVNSFTVYTSALSDALGVATNSLASVAIATDINETKLVAGVAIDTAFSAVAATLTVEASHNGTDWTSSIGTIIADTDCETTGVKLGELDLSLWKAPYYRLHFNAGGLSVGTSGLLQFIYAVK